MDNITQFVVNHAAYTLVLMLPNTIMSVYIVKKVAIYFQRYIPDALGGRNEGKTIYRRCVNLVSQTVRDYDLREKKPGFYTRAAEKLRKSGYRGEYAVIAYLTVKYVVVSIASILALVVNYPSVLEAIGSGLVILVTLETVVSGRRRKINLKLQKYMYKVYKYLHNQISSGVKVSDAIKTVYEVIDDRELRDILVRLSAMYELTLDIDSTLEEFRSNFDTHEVDTLCIALKQGIETGDNRELLARQEDMMFKKFFNYVQAETDNCKTKCIISAVMFTSIIVILIAIPLINDVSDAIGKIFVS